MWTETIDSFGDRDITPSPELAWSEDRMHAHGATAHFFFKRLSER